MVAVFENAPGWVGLGIPETAGEMVPGDAVIASDTMTPQSYDLTQRGISVSLVHKGGCAGFEDKCTLLWLK